MNVLCTNCKWKHTPECPFPEPDKYLYCDRYKHWDEPDLPPERKEVDDLKSENARLRRWIEEDAPTKDALREEIAQLQADAAAVKEIIKDAAVAVEELVYPTQDIFQVAGADIFQVVGALEKWANSTTAGADLLARLMRAEAVVEAAQSAGCNDGRRAVPKGNHFNRQYLEFAALHDKPDAQVLAFLEKHGPLGLNPHGEGPSWDYQGRFLIGGPEPAPGSEIPGYSIDNIFFSPWGNAPPVSIDKVPEIEETPGLVRQEAVKMHLLIKLWTMIRECIDTTGLLRRDMILERPRR